MRAFDERNLIYKTKKKKEVKGGAKLDEIVRGREGGTARAGKLKFKSDELNYLKKFQSQKNWFEVLSFFFFFE